MDVHFAYNLADRCSLVVGYWHVFWHKLPEEFTFLFSYVLLAARKCEVFGELALLLSPSPCFCSLLSLFPCHCSLLVSLTLQAFVAARNFQISRLRQDIAQFRPARAAKALTYILLQGICATFCSRVLKSFVSGDWLSTSTEGSESCKSRSLWVYCNCNAYELTICAGQ